MARRRRRSRRGRGHLQKNILAAALLLGVVVLGTAIFVTASGRKADIASIDKETFCKKDNLPAVLMVMVDASDSLDPVQRERALALVLKNVSQIPKYGRVDIYLMAEPGQELTQPTFSKCNPGPAGSALTTNAKGDEKKFVVEFQGAIENALALALTEKQAESSPLMESIRDGATRSFARTPDTTERKFIIVSDMLQYSAISNHYKNYQPVRELTRTPAWSSVITDLRGADVTIGYVARPTDGALQGQKHISWWEDYFQNIGGNVNSLENF